MENLKLAEIGRELPIFFVSLLVIYGKLHYNEERLQIKESSLFWTMINEGMISMSDSKKQSQDRQAVKNQKKLDASLKTLSAKQRREAAQERKEKRKTQLYIGAAAVVAVLIAALLFWDGGTIQKTATAVTVGSKKYSAVDVDYYYYSQYNNMISYASYYGLDPDVSLKEQEAYDGTTWYDYLCNGAKASLTNVSMLAQEAEAAGYEISEAGQANIDDAMAQLEEVTEQYGVSPDYYLKQMFGRYMTKGRYKKILTEYYYAYDYEDYKTESFEVTDDAINDYYQENKDTMDTYDLKAWYIDASVPAEQDEDGNDVEPTEEQIEAAVKGAKANAEDLEKAMKAGDAKAEEAAAKKADAADRSAAAGSAVNSYTYGEWAMSADRKAGDITVVESSAGSDEDKTIQGYYVVRFNGRKRDDYHPVNVRNILIYADEEETEDEDAEITYDYGAAKTAAEDVFVKFQGTDGTEDDFAALTEENSDDASTNMNGGINKSVNHGEFDDAVDQWIFDASRKAGDVEIIKDETNHGYQIVYFVGEDELTAWQQTAKSAIQSADYDEWFNDTLEKYEAETTFMYRFVG